MTRRVLIYGALVIALTAVGIIVSVILFGSDTAAVLGSSGIENTTRKPEPSPLAVQEPAQTPSADAGISHENKIRVLGILGTARRFQREEDAWSALVPGDNLRSEETVRTGDNSKLTLGVGKRSKLELAERAELTIGETTTEDRRFKLLRGRISVEYREKDRRIRIENDDGSAVAETEEGIFSVLNTGTTVAVATKTGSVDLFAGGKRVVIGAGEQSSTTDGAAPLRPTPIPINILLHDGSRLQNPKRELHRFAGKHISGSHCNRKRQSRIHAERRVFHGSSSS